MNIETQLIQLLNEAKKDRSKFKALKEMAVKIQSFDLAAELRKIEKEHFVANEDDRKMLKKVEDFQNALALVGLTVEEKHCYLIMQTAERVDRLGDQFTIKDAAEIKMNTNKFF